MGYPSYVQVMQAIQHLHQVRTDRWLHHELFSRQWWFLVVTFLLPLGVWWKLVQKARLIEIALFTVVMAVIITILDSLGTELLLWGYPYRLVPFFPKQAEYDYSGLPVVYSLLYQYFPKWKSFSISMVVLSAVYSFVLEPIFIHLRIYKPVTWNSFYSFPIYIAIGLFVKWSIDKMVDVNRARSLAR